MSYLCQAIEQPRHNDARRQHLEVAASETANPLQPKEQREIHA